MSDCSGSCDYFADDEYLCDPAGPNICGPCQKLSQPAKEAGAMLFALKTERQKLKQQANYNHERFIHHLPPELAGCIFELSIVEDVTNIEYYPNLMMPFDYTIVYAPLFVLSAVCRRWRAIARSTPRLWKALLLSNYYLPWPPISVITDWIDCAGKLPLSISVYVDSWYHRVRENPAIQIISLLNQYSNRWQKLKYEGPSTLFSYFSNDEQDLPLRTLQLANNHPLTYREDVLRLRTTQLSTLSISAVSIILVNVNWRYLTQLSLDGASLCECLEALRRASGLTQCAFRCSSEDVEDDEFPMPRKSIVHSNLQHFEANSPLLNKIVPHLSYPSLKTLRLETGCQPVELPLIVEFLEKSRCSLEGLSLRCASPLLSDMILLFQVLPTLEHLSVGFSTLSLAPKHLLQCLAEFSTIDGRQEPRYLPALRSLDLDLSIYTESFFDWNILPGIFGPPTGHSTTLHRYALECVTISSCRRATEDFFNGIDAVTRKRILCLGEAGVKWKMQIEGAPGRVHEMWLV